MIKTLICFSFLVSCTAQVFSQQSLIGTWRYETDYGVSQITFNGDNTVIIDGETSKYAIQGENIIVTDEYGSFSYPYQIGNGKLVITFPDGTQVEFQKTGQHHNAPSVSQGTGQQKNIQGGNVGQLFGKLCFYSGSSSTYSSYSRMEYIYFDGRGRFQFWKETSYSSDAGLAYGSDQDPNYVGSYSINGDVVVMTFDSGVQSTLRVYMRQNNGRITELMYKDKLYATGLCE